MGDVILRPGTTDEQYSRDLAGEGDYWDEFVARFLLKGDLPGSVDWRLAFTQHRYNLNWQPFCLGVAGINFRMAEIRRILLEAAPRPGVRVLDLGCGAGWLSLELARRGAHVTAVDISPTNLAIGRHMVETNARNFPYLYQNFAGLPCALEDFGSVEYVYSDLNTIDLTAGEYDAVVVWDSLHHVMEVERLLEQVRGSIKSGGVFLGVDHAVPHVSTRLFNLQMMPWLRSFYSWVSAQDPEWLYDNVNEAGRHLDLGLNAIDYDPTPVPNFKPFMDELLGELVNIVQATRPQEEAAAVPTAMTAIDEESPFEDVSAERLTRTLLESFRAERFVTVGPIIQPEKEIPPPRSEKERIFQDYLSAGLMTLAADAVERNVAAGQWFAFRMTAERSDADQAERLLPKQTEPTREGLQRLEQYSSLMSEALDAQTRALEERTAYLKALEREIERKNAALEELTRYARQLEQDLARAREPRLPWKRKSQG